MIPRLVRPGATAAVLLAAVVATDGIDPLGDAAPRAPVTVLISIDGLRPDYVLAADSLGLRIPNLRRLVARGSYATGVTGVVPSVTYPSHTTLLTGVAPARHGIHGNTTFDPLMRNEGGWYWYAEDIRVPTLWDAARDARLTTASVHWPVSVGANVVWNVPQIWRTGTDDDRKLLRALSTPGVLDTLERTLGPYADGADETIAADETRARFVEKLIEWKRPAFVTAYFTALDHEQHARGPFTPEVYAVLERIDAIVGEVTAAAERAGGGRAVIAVVSDHGFARIDREVNLLAAFRSAGLLEVASDTSRRPASWRATAWGNGASAAIVLRDSTDAATRARVRTLLDSLARDPANGIDRVLDARAVHERGGFPTASFLVAFRPGFTPGARLGGALVTPSASKGMHGYLPDIREMRSSFFVTGPGIPAHRSLGAIDMRDIAPTLAGLLGIALPSAEGTNLLSTRTAVR
jgi:predicted AlkP superfamily pyrophosphatase or phosphodiesterase